MLWLLNDLSHYFPYSTRHFIREVAQLLNEAQVQDNLSLVFTCLPLTYRGLFLHTEAVLWLVTGMLNNKLLKIEMTLPIWLHNLLNELTCMAFLSHKSEKRAREKIGLGEWSCKETKFYNICKPDNPLQLGVNMLGFNKIVIREKFVKKYTVVKMKSF